jgi:hypothetical protein
MGFFDFLRSSAPKPSRSELPEERIFAVPVAAVKRSEAGGEAKESVMLEPAATGLPVNRRVHPNPNEGVASEAQNYALNQVHGIGRVGGRRGNILESVFCR